MILIKYFSFAYQSNINGNIFLWFESLSSFALHNTSLFKHLLHCKLIFKRHFRKSKTFNKVNSERDCIFNQNSVAHEPVVFRTPCLKKLHLSKIWIFCCCCLLSLSVVIRSGWRLCSARNLIFIQKPHVCPLPKWKP